MLNHMFGEYIREKLGGSIVSMTWQESLLADQIGTLSLVDAENGANLLAKSNSGDFFLLDYFSYADPGFVTVDLLPDADTAKRIRLDATNLGVRTPFIIPVLAEVDVQLEYTNESAVNNLYVNISTLYLSKDKAAAFTTLCTDFVEAFFAMSSAIQVSANPSGTLPSYGSTATGRERCKKSK
jgi:hypothetical protein